MLRKRSIWENPYRKEDEALEDILFKMNVHEGLDEVESVEQLNGILQNAEYKLKQIQMQAQNGDEEAIKDLQLYEKYVKMIKEYMDMKTEPSITANKETTMEKIADKKKETKEQIANIDKEDLSTESKMPEEKGLDKNVLEMYMLGKDVSKKRSDRILNSFEKIAKLMRIKETTWEYDESGYEEMPEIENEEKEASLKKRAYEGGRGIGRYERGEQITGSTQVNVGDVLVMDTPQFEATNLVMVTSKDETGLNRDIFYVGYVDSETLKGISGDVIAIWGDQLGRNEFVYKAVIPQNKDYELWNGEQEGEVTEEQKEASVNKKAIVLNNLDIGQKVKIFDRQYEIIDSFDPMDGSQEFEIKDIETGKTKIINSNDLFLKEASLNKESSLYSELKALNIPMDNHESDLYVPLIPEVEEVLGKYPTEKENATIFVYEADEHKGEDWLDIPFAYEPYWEKKQQFGRAVQKMKGKTEEIPSLSEIDSGEHGYGDNYPKK